MHLRDVSIGFVGSGISLTMRTIRVQLDAVSSWFCGQFETVSPKQGGGWFVGGVIPIEE